MSVAALMELATQNASRFSWQYGYDEAEAQSALGLEIAKNTTNLTVLFNEGEKGLINRRFTEVLRGEYRKTREQSLKDLGAYAYEPEYVRLFLPFWFDRQDWQGAPVNGDSESEFKTTDAIDTAIDLKAGWDRLRDWQRNVVVARHITCPPTAGGQVDWAAVAAETGRESAESARTAYGKATRALAMEMSESRLTRGIDHDGPGSKPRITEVDY